MFTQAFDLVEKFVADRDSAGAVALVGYEGKETGPRAFGNLSFFPQPQPTNPDSIFDLASLSKVVSTTTITLKLIEDGVIRLDDPLGKLISNAPQDKINITIKELLAHTSGLPAVYPLYQDTRFRSKDTALETVLKVPLSYPTDTAVEYSCVGFITLALILEQLTGTTLDVLFQKLVAEPLKLKDTSYGVPRSKLDRAAYTEWDPEEKVFLRGVVHDENARGLGGVSGNAGLFSTAKDLGIFCTMLLQAGSYGGRQILKPNTVALLRNNYSPDPSQPRTLGWLLPSPEACSGSELISSHSIGHTGFTGTSIWIDFAKGFYGVLLTNRVHPSRVNTALIQFRPKFYRAICQAI
jgi:CubicO group peptidase (beta-lactamase class C family)